ncbi:hypothetical protein [Clostridium sp. ZS2-4]|uniref:hypothetical protein n=1 Tax=Clostridium sp. ZS2-4 TaxID=2987703 RepID=UPI00227B58A4|nr:hypothetical protein [Clostridium sp. ZS2-4]MCY6354155.1 hypothetical protein [Clostridium sp. ZS2-4]
MAKPLTFLTEETIKDFKVVALQPNLDIPFHSSVQIAEIPLTVSDIRNLVSLNVSVGWKVNCYFYSLSLRFSIYRDNIAPNNRIYSAVTSMPISPHTATEQITSFSLGDIPTCTHCEITKQVKYILTIEGEIS